MGRSIAQFSLWCLLLGPAAAQDLIISNARIIDGNGGAIVGGTLAIQSGVIVGDTDDIADATELDAGGMTVMPGMIDTHVHLSASPDIDQTALLFLQLGFTTIADNAGNRATLSELRERISRQEVPGPRILIAGALVGPQGHPVDTICRFMATLCEDGVEIVSDPDRARVIVSRYGASGFDAIKSIYEGGPETRLSDEVLLAIAQEADSVDLPFIVHTLVVEDALHAVELGADRLVHAPFQPLTESVDMAALARTLVESSIPVATTTHIFMPVEDDSGNLLTHQGQPYPENELPFTEIHMSRIRALWDAGVPLAFGSDTFAPDPRGDIRHEIATLSRTLDAGQILRTLTRNAADYLEMGSEIGTIETGKRADLVIIDGDPLADISELENVKLVIKDGRIVVDNR